MLDLRKPAGYFFAMLGLILVITGALAQNYTAPLLTVNLNLYFGVFCIVFGAVFLWLARRA
jgi:hypothetical protein